MTRNENGWDAVAEAWQSPEAGLPDAAGFEAELRRRRRNSRLVVGGELLITAFLVWITVELVRGAAASTDAVAVGGLWLIWLVATGLAWWNRWGQLEQSAASTEAFVRLSLERARRKVRVVWITLGLLVAQVLFLGWLWGRGGAARPSGNAMPGWWLILGVFAAYLAWCVWYYRRSRSEGRHFSKLLREIEGASEGFPP